MFYLLIAVYALLNHYMMGHQQQWCSILLLKVMKHLKNTFNTSIVMNRSEEINYIKLFILRKERIEKERKKDRQIVR